MPSFHDQSPSFAPPPSILPSRQRRLRIRNPRTSPHVKTTTRVCGFPKRPARFFAVLSDASSSVHVHGVHALAVLPVLRGGGRRRALSSKASRPPVRNAHIAILTDFSANPVLAMRDRASDPVFAAMLFTSLVCGAVASRVASVLGGGSAASVSSGGTASALAGGNASASVDSMTAAAAAAAASGAGGVGTGVGVGAAGDTAAGDTAAGDAAAAVGGSTSASSGGVGPPLSAPTPGENAVWLNMSLRTLWRLFRKSTAFLTCRVLQPVLDNLELPSLVQSIRIDGLSLGNSPALLRSIVRVPSRSLSETQFRFRTRLIVDSDGLVDLKVKLKIPGLPVDVSVPIRITNLDIDACVWLAFTFVPYPPWIRFAQWALTEMPSVTFNVGIGNLIPITSVPLLSTVIKRIISVDIPRHFLFPKAVFVDFLGESGQSPDQAMDVRLLDARGISPTEVELSDDDAHLRATYPNLSALFDLLDVNNDGKLDKQEVLTGLVEWGFATEVDQSAMYALLDVSADGFIQLNEFITVWSDLDNVFVPRRFRGVVSGTLLRAEDLRTPFIGFSDPYVVLSVEAQSRTSGNGRPNPKRKKRKGGWVVWNEGWELYVQQPKTAYLSIEVRESSPFAFYRDYLSAPPLPASHSGVLTKNQDIKQANRVDSIIGCGSIPLSDISTRAQNLWVPLTSGGGLVNIDVQFNEFVDPRYSND